MLRTKTTRARPYRSVLDYETHEDLVKALKRSFTFHPSTFRDDGDENNSTSAHSASGATEVSDWQLSVYDPNTTLVPTVGQEAARLEMVRDYRILETRQEPEFDALIAQIQQYFHVPWAYVSIMDLGRQWFKAQVSVEAQQLYASSTGTPLGFYCKAQQTSRQDAFCAHTISQKNPQQVFQVRDALQDSRFCSNPLVANGLRFYAGAPLVSPDGQRLGTVCISDSQARPEGLSMEQQDKLLRMAACTVDLLVQRRARLSAADEKVHVPVAEPELAGTIESTKIVHPVQPSENKHQFRSMQQPQVDQPWRVDSIKRTASHLQSPKDNRCPPSPTSEAPEKRTRSFSDLTQLDAELLSDCNAAPSKQLPTMVIPVPPANVTLPDPSVAGVHPNDFLIELIYAMYGAKVKITPASDLQNFFPTLREEQMAAYSMDVVSATRNNDVQQLQSFYEQRGRTSLDCYNRFGEGLLNLSCRRGFQEIVQFLLSDGVALNPRVCDDYGRTALHDACWNPEPQLEICRMLMQRDPSLWLISDKRGFSPFQYARDSDFHIWRDFLLKHREYLHALVQPETLVHFSADTAASSDHSGER